MMKNENFKDKVFGYQILVPSSILRHIKTKQACSFWYLGCWIFSQRMVPNKFSSNYYNHFSFYLSPPKIQNSNTETINARWSKLMKLSPRSFFFFSMIRGVRIFSYAHETSRKFSPAGRSALRHPTRTNHLEYSPPQSSVSIFCFCLYFTPRLQTSHT